MKFDYQVRGTLGIGNPAIQLLKNRGITNPQQFMNPTDQNLEDVHLLDNIDSATDIFLWHMNNNSKVMVLQDCDCDGITSAAVMVLYIKDHFPEINVKTIIHEKKEHGLDPKSMDIIQSSYPDLLIIPDAGSNDLRQLKTLKSNGIDVIVLDHHDESETVTKLKKIYHLDNLNAYGTIVNNQMSSSVKDKSMTGVGIVYKFCSLLDKKLNYDVDKFGADKYLDLVALGMIADSCDLTQLQTRYLVLKGIQQIQEETNHNKFITELIKSQSFSLKGKATITGLSFYIAPLINALIRLGTMEDKEYLFKAFLNSDEKVTTKIRGKGEVELSVQEYARRLCESYKRKQQKLTTEYLEVIEEQIKEFDLNNYPVICCKAENSIENTFTGLIANKITSLYNKPCVLLRELPNDYLMGSARGFDKSHIKDIKQFCLDTKLFDKAEGHPNACGVGIFSDKISAFYEYLSSLNYDNSLSYTVDAELTDKTLTESVIKQISSLGDIWGTNVEEPLFAIVLPGISAQDCKFYQSKDMENTDGMSPKDIKGTMKLEFHNIEIIKFKTNQAEYDEIIATGDNLKFTIIGRLNINEYNGTKTPQVIVENWYCEKSTVVKKAFRF